MEENNESNNGPTLGNNPVKVKRPVNGITIAGYNLAVLAFYTLSFKLLENEGGAVLDAFVLFLHVSVCLIMSIGKKSWWWLLAALLVLTIGFSTCTMISFKID